jgi:transcriptional regulator with XRE-family HTH domain
MIDAILPTADELSRELAARLRKQRLSLRMTQAELAARAGVNIGTVKNIEHKGGTSSLVSIIRVAQVLGLADQLQSLFVVSPRSIAQMELAHSAPRHRARPRVVR